MKKNTINLKFALLFGAAVILAIFVTRPGHAQDTGKKESHKKIVLKIVSDDNGKTTIIDTTMEFSDSAMIDSIKKEIDKVIVIGKGGKHARIRMQQMPEGFDYQFEIPPIPDCQMLLEDIEELEMDKMDLAREMENFHWEQRAPRMERRMLRMDNHRQTLTDVLGDIPMDRVKSYSIKDRKDGKRIIIDLNDAPMFDREKDVIIIREPARMHRPKKSSGRKVKVYMNPEEDIRMEKAPESQTPPSPPPASEPQKQKSETPKI